MTLDGKSHIGEDGIPDVRGHPAPVISSGGIMLLENIVKADTAARSREIFLVVGNTGLFNAFHLSRFAANAPPQPSAAPPMGEPSFNGAVWTLIFFTQISILDLNFLHSNLNSFFLHRHPSTASGPPPL
jgi:hypothetical protein